MTRPHDDDAKLHERAGPVFVRVRRLPVAQRAAALDAACGGDDALRREVQALLDADAGPGLDAERMGQQVLGAVRRIVDAPATTRPVPERLGGCRIVRRLGEGGMGTVYEAVVETGTAAVAEGTRVAVKVLHADLMEAPGSLERLRREGAIGRSLRHEHVVRTIDCASTTEGGRRTDFLLMELVHGTTLHALRQERGPLSEAECRRIARSVALGLAAIHAAGAVHRDLKPENVFVTHDGVVKIMDLGIALVISDAARLTRPGAFVGSLQYAPPEQLRSNGRLDGRADLYSLGVVLHELVTGVNPFRDTDWHGVMRRVLNEKPPRLRAVAPGITPFFEALVGALLEKEPERRIASAEALASILEQGESSPWWRQRAPPLGGESR